MTGIDFGKIKWNQFITETFNSVLLVSNLTILSLLSYFLFRLHVLRLGFFRSFSGYLLLCLELLNLTSYHWRHAFFILFNYLLSVIPAWRSCELLRR